MKAGLALEVDVDYGQFYLFDGELQTANPEGADFFEDPWLMEHRCTSIGSSAIVLTSAHHGPTPVEIVAVDDADAADPAAWDHVVEMSMEISSGRLGVIGWDSTGPVNVLDVAPGDNIVRILWGGLEKAERADDGSGERLRIEVRPGPPSPSQLIRPWRSWVPAEHERQASNGLRLFLGGIAYQRAHAMTPVNLLFWNDNPATPDGSVGALLLDPESGTHFASGYTRDGYNMLRELTDDELADLTAAGDPYRLLFLIDERGHIWNTQMPLRRTVALQHIPPENFAMIRQLGRPEDQPEPLPPGWDRIVRITMEHPEPVDVDAVGDPEPGVTYQRRRSVEANGAAGSAGTST